MSMQRGISLPKEEEEEKNGCGPIAGNHWLNYVTPSLLGLRRYPKLTRRKWQPPHNMGEPQMENTLDNTFKHRNCTNGQILRSGSKLIEAGDYTSI